MERPDEPNASEPAPDNTPDLPAVAEALSRLVRETLERGERAEVPDLGTFRVKHQASRMEESAEGRSVTPPRDEVVFESAREPGDTTRE